MTLDFKKLPSFSLVMHGWDQKIDLERLLPCFEKFFARVGVKPETGSVKGAPPAEMKSYSYHTIKQRIADGRIKKLQTLSLLHLSDKSDKGSEDFALDVNDSYGRQEASILNAISDRVTAESVALDFLRELLRYISPYYGYSLEMPLGHFPLMYASGVFGRTERERDEATAWQDASTEHLRGLLYKKGMFRLVFGINVLSRSHVANMIGNKTFMQWVGEPGHGRLEQWKDDVWVWFVPSEDRVRCASVLQFNHLLTAPPGFESELIG